MKFSIMDFFSKCDQIRRLLRIWSHLLKKSLMENFIFCAVTYAYRTDIFQTNFAEQRVKPYEINFLELIEIAKYLWMWFCCFSGLYSHAFSDSYLEITIMHDTCLLTCIRTRRSCYTEYFQKKQYAAENCWILWNIME